MKSMPAMIVSCAVLAGVPNAHALEIEEASIADIEAAYRDGELTAHEVVAAYLARIDAYDKQGPYINSIINYTTGTYTTEHQRSTYATSTISLRAGVQYALTH